MKHIFRIKIGACLVLLMYIAHTIGVFDHVTSCWPVKDLKLAMHIPQSFGKTHFIVGYDENQKIKKPQPHYNQQPVDLTPLTYTVLFSPDDDVRGALIDLIEHEQADLKIAMFTCTDDQVARALIKASNRGIPIQLITDSVCLKDRNNKIALLCEHGIEVFVYNASDATGRKNSNSCMHHKFILFKRNRSDNPLVWTGSCNTTKSAFQFNQENVVIIQNQALFERYALQFERIKKRAYQYGNARRHYDYK